MRSDLGSRLLWAWTAAVAVASSVPLFLGESSGEGLIGAAGSLAWQLLPLLFTVQAALIVRRRPGNTVAWLLMIIGFGVLVTGIADAVVADHQGDPTFWENVALAAQNGWLAIIFPVLLLLFVFPTGRFLTHAWRWAGWLAGILVTVFLFLGVFAREWGSPQTWTVVNPLGFIPMEVVNGAFFSTVFTVGILALAFGGLAALVVRFRRADITERTQIKWFLYAAVVFAMGVAVIVALQEASPEADVTLTLALALAVLPVSITIAITRYKLFEIDRIISRTLSYTILVALLAAVFLGVVTLTTALLPTQNTLGVAGSTLAVAALFNPLRKRIQRMIDRRFNRSGYQVAAISEQFSDLLREPLNEAEITDLWERTVEEALRPREAAIWLKSTT